MLPFRGSVQAPRGLDARGGIEAVLTDLLKLRLFLRFAPENARWPKPESDACVTGGGLTPFWLVGAGAGRERAEAAVEGGCRVP